MEPKNMDVTQIPKDMGKRIIELARIAAMIHLEAAEKREGEQFGEGADRAPADDIWPMERPIDCSMDWLSSGREAA
jgi:hypothetical protein